MGGTWRPREVSKGGAYWLNGDHEQSVFVSLMTRETSRALSSAVATSALIAFAAAWRPYGVYHSGPGARNTAVRLAAVAAYCDARSCIWTASRARLKSEWARTCTYHTRCAAGGDAFGSDECTGRACIVWAVSAYEEGGESELRLLVARAAPAVGETVVPPHPHLPRGTEASVSATTKTWAAPRQRAAPRLGACHLSPRGSREGMAYEIGVGRPELVRCSV